MLDLVEWSFAVDKSYGGKIRNDGLYAKITNVCNYCTIFLPENVEE